jgi:hypothetical protein
MARHFGILKNAAVRQREWHNPEAPMDDADDRWREPPNDQSPWWWLIVIVLVCAIMTGLIMAFTWGASAHDHKRPDLDHWFDALQSSGGYPCCSYADGSMVADVDWDTSVVNGEDRYRVRIDGNWIVVSPQEVVTAPNRHGAAIAWIYKDSVGMPNVRCFMPGAGG